MTLPFPFNVPFFVLKVTEIRLEFLPQMNGNTKEERYGLK